MQTGFQKVDGDTYYFSTEDGSMQTGRLIIAGKKYYLQDNGVMYTGWIDLEDGRYFFHGDGVMATGWHTFDGKRYHFNTSTGRLDKNMLLDGYNITDDGTAVPYSDVQKRAQSIINNIGTTSSAVYNYVVNHNQYSFIENTRSLAEIERVGWGAFANYAMDNRRVVCYYFAAITDILFKHAGFTSRIVYGTGYYTSDHYWNQIYVDGKWVNFDTCNRLYAVSDEYLKQNNYTWTQLVYPKYY